MTRRSSAPPIPASTPGDHRLGEMRQRQRLGDLMVSRGLLTSGELAAANRLQTEAAISLVQALIRLEHLTEPQILKFWADQLELPLVDLKRHPFDLELVRLLPEGTARRLRALVLENHSGILVVGLADPTDLFVVDELTRLLNRAFRLALISESDLPLAMERLYRPTGAIDDFAEALGEEMARLEFNLEQLTPTGMDGDAPVVLFLQSLFEDAVRVHATDIHIEPDETLLRIRQRIDGILHERIVKERRIAPALLSKLKLMAGLEIAERRLPQDGRFNLTVRDRRIDVRLSTLPVQHGESAALRLLDRSGDHLKLDQLGLGLSVLERLRRLIRQPYGLILVTGPTGSGKTTTLYSALNEINDPAKKIITVEDPVEYRMTRINQIQVKPRIGLTFAGILRHVLRHDPDIILVGEMRDQETAEMAVRAALTGHLVLSTLHTNDAFSAATRLLDLGVAGYAAASALLGILAQRLVRRICRECAAPTPPSQAQLAFLAGLAPDMAASQWTMGQGCPNCMGTGYLGRQAVAELLEITPSLVVPLRHHDLGGFQQAAHAQTGYRPLQRAALDLAGQGITSLAEVTRLAAEFSQI